MTDYVSRSPQRVRFPLRFRHAQVVSAENLTPNMRRIVIAGEELEGFESQGFDDHVKLFPPLDGRAQILPSTDADNNPVWPDPMPVGRDYTPRYFDPQTRELTLDFAIGHGGPATAFAEQAKPGDAIGMGGPRGSFLVPVDYEQQLLIGDDTALPAIARRLEELPAGRKVIACIEVEDEGDEQPLPTKADAEIIWVHRKGTPRGDGQALTAAALEAAKRIDPKDAFVWAACESAVARSLRAKLLEVQDFNTKSMRVSAYWRINQNDILDVIEG